MTRMYLTIQSRLRISTHTEICPPIYTYIYIGINTQTRRYSSTTIYTLLFFHIVDMGPNHDMLHAQLQLEFTFFFGFVLQDLLCSEYLTDYITFTFFFSVISLYHYVLEWLKKTTITTTTTTRTVTLLSFIHIDTRERKKNA